MKYETELTFAKELLNNWGLPLHLVGKSQDLESLLPDYGLRKLLNPDFNYEELLDRLAETCHPNTIYRIQDPSISNYLVFLSPGDGEAVYVVIGPYTLIPFSKESLLESFERYSLPPESLPQLEKYYQHIPYLKDESLLLTLIYTLGEKLWGSTDNFSIQECPDISLGTWIPPNQHKREETSEDPFLSINILEDRYSDENELMQAVASGQTYKAGVLLHTFSLRQMEQRVTDPLRNKKNYAIIINTLLRKAAEQGAVHPFHLDSLSSQFASKIELCASPKAVDNLLIEMTRKYCLLVQEHSLKGYSPLIRKSITLIDSDLTADLSLYAQAKLLNVNSSYLSALFKKETGVTLTEYVNKKRIKQAAFLLSTTCLQIQTIAERCGIPDVNYFIKIFKKYVGKTPKDYRDHPAPH